MSGMTLFFEGVTMNLEQVTFILHPKMSNVSVHDQKASKHKTNRARASKAYLMWKRAWYQTLVGGIGGGLVLRLDYVIHKRLKCLKYASN